MFIPPPASCNLVTAQAALHQGRQSLRVTPLDGLGPADLIDKPSFALLPNVLTNGTIEVEVAARLRRDAPDFARGFAGLAFRIQPDLVFEAVYLRPLNGQSLNPPPPRHLRAIQYFAYPGWDFQTLRDAYPDGSYEAAADIRPNTWHSLRLTIDGTQITAYVDEIRVLGVTSKSRVQPGQVGLWVDIGTEAFFTNLRTTS